MGFRVYESPYSAQFGEGPVALGLTPATSSASRFVPTIGRRAPTPSRVIPATRIIPGTQRAQAAGKAEADRLFAQSIAGAGRDLLPLIDPVTGQNISRDFRTVTPEQALQLRQLGLAAPSGARLANFTGPLAALVEGIGLGGLGGVLGQGNVISERDLGFAPDLVPGEPRSALAGTGRPGDADASPGGLPLVVLAVGAVLAVLLLRR